MPGLLLAQINGPPEAGSWSEESRMPLWERGKESRGKEVCAKVSLGGHTLGETTETLASTSPSKPHGLEVESGRG